MKFFDKVNIELKAGKGGDGVVAARREIYVSHGGPAGGDGGDGGNIIFVADEGENTLTKYRYNKLFRAQHGENGKGKDKYGKSAPDMILPVPIGTIIKDNSLDKILFQFKKHGEKFVAAKGGRGGAGNIHFKNSQNQFPNFALLGEPGNEKEISLELQMLGDLALIGTPSVGKSSIINAISNVKAKTADYHFTTLIPNIGVVEEKNCSYTVVDIPGLIQGASEGKGLGNAFLRHILKAKIFAFVIDLSRYETGIKEIPALYNEIIEYINTRFVGSKEFGEEIKKVKYSIEFENELIIFNATAIFKDKSETTILSKAMFFIFNKYDTVNDPEIFEMIKKDFLKSFKENINSTKFSKTKLTQKILDKNLSLISAATRFGIKEFKYDVSKIITTFKSLGINEFQEYIYEPKVTEYVTDITNIEMQKLIDEEYIDESDAKYIKIWEISNKELSRLVYILPWGNDEAEDWFWNTLLKEGYLRIFERSGVQKGDVLKIKSFYSGTADRYILWE